MKLAIMQPYLFPYLGYFQLIHAADKFVFYDDVNYIKNGWINRNRFLLAGEVRYFTVPLAGASPFKPISATRIQPPTLPWRRKLLETMRVAYRGARCSREGLELLEASISIPTDSIADIARHSVTTVLDYLGLRREVIDSSSSYENASLHGQARVLDICRREAAKMYINPPGGRDLYDEAAFRAEGLDLRFLSSSFPTYEQSLQAFVPGLSILDIIMRCPGSSAREMVEAYCLMRPSSL